jgi:hypothetical protein
MSTDLAFPVTSMLDPSIKIYELGSNKIRHADSLLALPLVSLGLIGDGRGPISFIITSVIAIIAFVFLYYKSKFRKHGTISIVDGRVHLSSKKYGWENKTITISEIQSFYSCPGYPYIINFSANADAFSLEIRDSSLPDLLINLHQLKPDLVSKYTSELHNQI